MTTRHLACTVATAIAATLASVGMAACSHPRSQPAPATATVTVTATATPTPASPRTAAGGFGQPRPPQPVPPGRRGVPHGGLINPASVDQHNPTAVGRAVLIVMYRHDTAIDNTPLDALRRARPWLTPLYRAGFTAARPHGAGTRWATWTAHHAYTTVTLRGYTDASQPDDTTRIASRSYRVTYTPTGRDHWHGHPTTVTAYLTLTRANPHQPWRVDALTVH